MPGAAQTPCQFLNGGAAAKFSEKCVQELLKAGFLPEQFGSYKYVRQRCDQARARVKQEEAWKKNEKGAKKPKPPVSDIERRDAKSDSAHISQNAVHESPRGNQCSDDRTDGYDHDLAPCMPQESSRLSKGKAGDHDVCTQAEVRQNKALREGREDGKSHMAPMVYKDPQRTDNERERLRQVADDPDAQKRRGAKKIERAPYTQPAGPPETAPAAAPGEGDKYKKASFNAPLDGNTAAECIEAFKNAAMDAMKQECKDNVEKNQVAAYGSKRRKGETDAQYEARTKKWREQKQRAAAETAEKYKQTAKDQRAATRALSKAEAANQPKSKSTPATRKALKEAQAERKAAVAANQKADAARRKAFHEAPDMGNKKLDGERSAATQAKCRAAQGERLRGKPKGLGPPKEVFRVPFAWPDKKKKKKK